MAQNGHGAISDLSPLCAPKRMLTDHSEFMGSHLDGEAERVAIVPMRGCPSTCTCRAGTHTDGSFMDAGSAAHHAAGAARRDADPGHEECVLVAVQ